MIPRIIHQIWVGPRPRPDHWMRTWRELNPSFEYKLWDETCWESFGFRHIEKIREANELAGKADIMRYEILDRFGGIFIDADSECVLPLDDSFLAHEAFCCWENELVRPGLIANGYIGSIPNGQLVQKLIERLDSISVNAERAWMTTGPLFFSHTVRLTKAPLHIYPSHYFLPEHYSGAKYYGDGPVYAKQYWGSTKGVYQ